jgi:peroxiredoxin
MIRQTIITLALCFGAGSAFAQQSNPLQLTGTVADTVVKKVYLQKFYNKVFTTIDSAEVTGTSFKFTSAVVLPELYGLSTDTTRTPLYIFLDSAPVSVKLSPVKNYSTSVVTGSAAQDLFNTYKKDRTIEIGKFITENPASIVSAYTLYRNWAYRLSPEQIKANMALLDKSLVNSSYVVELNKLLVVLDGLAIGKKAPEFSAEDPSGKKISLADNHKGYTLIDFWASWCMPCRKENPNVVAAFEKYKSKGFSVFGVSLDKNKASWIKGISDDHLNWPQVSELVYWKSEIAKMYGVKAIPANYLIDSKGIIVAKNLRGEKLQEKLKELLDN